MASTYLEHWRPPRGFTRAHSALRGVVVAAPSTAGAQVEGPRSFGCPRCGATLAYDVSVAGASCEHCGYTREVEAAVVGHRAVAHAFTNEALRSGAQGWGVERRELHCDDCSANVSMPAGELSTRCACCGSTHVRVHEGETQARPGHVVPLTLPEQQAAAAAREWLGEGWMHPGALRQLAQVGAFTPMYLPFWVFSSGVDATWRCQVGTDYRDSEGNTKTSWRWKDGSLSTQLGFVRVTGTGRVSEVLQDRMVAWDLSALTAYDPDFLVGIQSLVFERGLPEAWELGKQRLRQRTQSACRRAAGGDRQRKWSIQADLRDEAWQYVLLPAYVTAYQFRGRTWQVIVDGQTGQVVGQKPVARWKVWGAIILAWMPGLFLAMISLPLMFLPPAGPIVAFIALVCLILAFAWSRQVLVSAEAAEQA